MVSPLKFCETYGWGTNDKFGLLKLSASQKMQKILWGLWKVFKLSSKCESNLVDGKADKRFSSLKSEDISFNISVKTIFCMFSLFLRFR
jgi:hypothetical protein